MIIFFKFSSRTTFSLYISSIVCSYFIFSCIILICLIHLLHPSYSWQRYGWETSLSCHQWKCRQSINSYSSILSCKVHFAWWSLLNTLMSFCIVFGRSSISIVCLVKYNKQVSYNFIIFFSVCGQYYSSHRTSLLISL